MVVAMVREQYPNQPNLYVCRWWHASHSDAQADHVVPRRVISTLHQSASLLTDRQ